jgi:ABC-type bacteriocin/lantibiotic exporter with double-glycine peptidase domain
MEVCKIVNLHEDIIKMKDGYNSNVGESGAKLSGGQRQRLSIARCLLKDSPILILDEGTSSLDPLNEHSILQHLINLKS